MLLRRLLLVHLEWEESPFKTHLRISDSVPIARKVTKRKATLPPAISGKEYLQFLQRKRDEKVKQSELKEERQKKRELKKAEKNVQPQKGNYLQRILRKVIKIW